jgi:aminopeptidase
MTDPRVTKLADVLINFALLVQPGEKILINAGLPAEEAALEAYKAVLLAGANPTLITSFPRADELYYKYSSNAQLEFIPPIMKMYEVYDRILFIYCDQNTRSLSGIDPKRRTRWLQANNTWFKLMALREGLGQWCSTMFPSYASAQESNMSLPDFEDYVFRAGKLDSSDPKAEWKALIAQMHRYIDWLNGHDRIKLKGSDIDLEMSFKGRVFYTTGVKANFPGGEFFTSPVEDSANGWIRFRHGAIIMGQEVSNIQMWFENGKVVKETADKGQELLTAILNTDAGARFLGELAVGTNYSVTRVSHNMLFDEKMGGTIHIALGEAFPQTGGKNESGLHWDILCDMWDSEITVDGELFYRNGKPLGWVD